MAKDRFPAHNDQFLQKMLAEKQTERAAAVCLFTLRLKMAVQ
uniref:Uncharacterized protein n=1 Tax=Romanomermis culicivorax TaxID=13658 RepID=A0A915LEI3_ROMCU